MPHETSLSTKPKPGAIRRQVKGEPFVWLSGGATATGIVMIVMLLGYVVFEGTRTFWPQDIEVFVVGESRYTVVEFRDDKGNPLPGPDAPGAIEHPIDESGNIAGADGKPVDKAGKRVGDKPFLPLTVARLREVADRFKDRPLFLKDGAGLAKDGERPLPASEYLANRDKAATPYMLYDAEGNLRGIDEITGKPAVRDHTALMGTVRSDKPLDTRDLPRKRDGTPWQSYELPKAPTEGLVRQGNQGEGLYSGHEYFIWLKRDVPDEDAYRTENVSGYQRYVLERFHPTGVAEIERLEKGVLTGWVVGIYDGEKPLASVEKDGLEGVWAAFNKHLAEMRQVYLKRYDLERNAIGRVNFELEDRKRELLTIRYNNRKSAEMMAAIEKLTEAYADWIRAQPVVKSGGDEAAGRKAYETQLVEWRKSLNGVLDAWEKDDGGLNLNEEQKKALGEARKIQERRGDLHAMSYAMLRFEVDFLREREKQVTLRLRTLKGLVATEPLAAVVRGFRPNELGVVGKFGVYFDRVGEFLTADPRESNSEGGIFMVILGTLVMTMVMCILVVPIGVIAALYLREYAKQGPLVSTVRIAVNNLAGVPSIVFGMFGLGLFCVVVGKSIDQIFFPELGSTPTFGGGGILWASLTLALLTVPVVIVATEEALIAVPSSQREASLACGASRFQTIRRVILPQAMPGILTGTILAMARGAGEVAPLMLVGVVKYAPYAPVDGVPPFLHLERKFMHLGFHIFDLGFQSPDAEKTKPLVFSTTLVLIALVAVLNIFAIRIRNKIRSKLQSSHV